MGLVRGVLGWPRRLARRFARTFSLDRGSLAVAVVVFLASSVAGSAVGYRGYLWAWIDPEFCYICHIHDYAVEDWRRSIHGEVVTCHDCHRVPLMHYTRTLVHTFYDRPTFPEDLHELPRISSETCESCHLAQAAAFHELSSPMPEEIFESIVRVDESPAHVWHMEASARDPGDARGGSGGGPARTRRLPQHGLTATEVGYGTGNIECIDCHGSEANRFHNFQARAENCYECHEDLKVRGDHLSDFDCRHCHFQEFLAPGDVRPVGTPSMALPILDPMIQ